MVQESLKDIMARKQRKEIKGEKIEEFKREDGDNEHVWMPDEVGDKIEGLCVAIVTGPFGEQIVIKIEDGREVTLPAHADLKKKTRKVFEGDYVWVELVRIIKSNNPDYNDKLLYKLELVEANEVPIDQEVGEVSE